MRIGSLFSGIGGLELGLERAGLGSVAWQVERDPYCRHILARHWPDVPRFDDVRTVGAHNLPRVDVLCGGFPCQDLSAAGKGAGLEGARSGLWYEMRRIIDELRPTWVVVENVAHTWRRYVPVVRRALWGLGYASVPIRVRACDVGARHERARILVAATLDADVDLVGLASRFRRVGPTVGSGRVAGHGSATAEPARRAEPTDAPGLGCGARSAEHGSERPGRAEPAGVVAADADGARSPGHRPGYAGAPGGGRGEDERSEAAEPPANDARLGLAIGEHLDGDAGEQRAPAAGGADDGVSPGFGLPPRPWMVRGVHGLPGWVDGARRSGWTPARIREARIRGLGNAVVPAVAEAVGELIRATFP